jgi:sugar-specific transcriptional regulator TrmB
MDNNLLKYLKMFGLTKYEASCYLTLNYMISATATEISKNANVPRSRIYDVLKPLIRRGFIEVEKGRPSKYSVIPPSEIFRSNKNEIIEGLENAEFEINEIYENQLSKVPAPVWLIHGTEKIIKKELEIISRARKSVNIRMGFLFNAEWELLIHKLKQKAKQGVEVNIMILQKYFANNVSKDIKRESKKSNINFVNFPLPYAKMMVRDEKEMIHVFAKFKERDKQPIPETAIGVWNQYEDIAKSYNERFEIAWNKKIKSQKRKFKN